MQNFSATQAGNYAALLGFVLTLLKVNIGNEELTQAVSAVLVLAGLGTSWYQRFKRGDLTLGGFRK